MTSGQTHDLDAYSAKRDFEKTPEPAARQAQKAATRAATRRFVVQHHLARRNHFDLRLEIAGALKSWAVTRGPSACPKTRRLAVRVEDHPLDYADFEGVIPAGSYGAGLVMLWDRGTWFGPSDEEALRDLSKGHLKFTLNGERLRGRWALVRMGAAGAKENWLLIKERDSHAEKDDSISARFTTSVATGRTFEEIEKGVAARHKKRSVTKPKNVPRFIPPMLCTLVTTVPTGEGWVYEMKYDGYRMQLVIGGNGAKLYTRTGLDWTARFSEIAAAGSTLPPAILDGEIVVFDERGLANFAALAAALGRGPAAPMTFVAFDVLRVGDRDVTGLPLTKRKELLEGLLAKFQLPDLIRVAPTMSGDGQKLLEQIARAGAEGLIAKRADSTYRTGRSRSWLKIKATNRRDVVVIGYTPSSAGRAFASLAVADEEKGKLRYCGRVGTAFTARKEAELAPRLKELERETPPAGIEGLDLVPAKVRWVEPKLVIAVRHRGVTGSGLLRAASYLGLREDMKAPLPALQKAKASSGRSRRPSTGDSAKVRLTNASRVVFPDCGVTKGDLADYYARAADRILPHLDGRPISIVRAPDGLAGGTFFQRHPMASMKQGIVRIPDPEKKHRDYMAIEGPAGLATIVQFGGIELHGWGARLQDLSAPDRMVFDLDPDEGVTFQTLRESALLLKSILAVAGLKSFPLMTGGKGIHVVVPLNRTQTWQDVETFSAGLARHLVRLEPSAFTATASKRRRKGRIFIDWLRNKPTATAIIPYSVRARPGAPVATPVSWSGLNALEQVSPYGLRTVPLTGRDPWLGYFALNQAINPQAIDMIR